MTPKHARIERLREYLRHEFNVTAPRGMPRQTGLLYQPIPFPEFADLPHERDSSPAKFDMLRRSLDFSGKRVLDLGCANGYFEFRLAALPQPPEKIVAVEAFDQNVRIVRELQDIYEVQGVEFVHARVTRAFVEQLLDRESFDVVLMLSLHHHLVRDDSIESIKALFKLLYDRCGVVVIEQGSLTQDEYTLWTHRTEAFFTYAFTRLVSMFEACGIPREHCRVIGEAMYQSGRRADDEGAGRVVVAASRTFSSGVEWFDSKRHANGMVNELILHSSNGKRRFMKHSLRWPSYLPNEVAALRRLAHSSYVPQIIENETSLSRNMLVLEPLELRKVTPDDLAGTGEEIRRQFVEALGDLARAGVVHNEINPLHVLIAGDSRLRIIDFETAYTAGTNREQWVAEISDTNPKIGLDVYPREMQQGHEWMEIDLISADALLDSWHLARLSAEESAELRTLYRASFGAAP